jgi:starch synthase (maltosyl-transferring)
MEHEPRPGVEELAKNEKYQDVYPFDFESVDWKNLWSALRDVFLFWCKRDVRVFRVDNPHTKPVPFWEWCLREVQTQYPDAIFLAEAFTRPKMMYALGKSGFSQSYTYFTWRVTKHDIQAYLNELVKPPVADFYRPNFWPTTPDIFPEHLVHGGRAAFIGRFVLASTLGASYGIYGPSYELMEHEPRPGVEELAKNEKYQIRTWDLSHPDSLKPVIARVNRIRKSNPALADMRSLRFHRTDNDLVIAYSKQVGDSTILVAVNLDPHHTHRAWIDLDLAALGLTDDRTFQVHDLLSGARFSWRGRRNFVELVPEQMPAHIFELRKFARSENQFEYFL